MIFRYIGGAALLILGLTMALAVVVPAQITGLLLIIGAIGLIAGI